MGMDTADREMCLKEISSDILDSEKMVTISTLSENWNINLKIASDLLEDWLKQNPKSACVRQYLVRGIGNNGQHCMTILPEEKLSSLPENNMKFKMIYSIKGGTQIPPLQIPSYLDAKKKRLKLPEPLDKRETLQEVHEVESKQEVPAKKFEKEKPSSAQSSAQPSKSLTNGGTKSVPTMFKNVKVESKTPAKENKTNNTSTSPKKKSPIKKEPPGKKNSTIGAFFSAKPASQNGTTQSASKPTVAKTKSPEKEKIVKSITPKAAISAKQEISNGKRNDHSSDEEVTGTPKADNPPKRRKIAANAKARKQGSRIMLLASSDSEDDNAKKPEVKSESEEEIATKEENNSSETITVKRRVKKTRMVTRVYEEEDGYIRTIKEKEIYSLSEDEDEPPSVKVKAETLEAVKKSSPKTKVSSPKKATINRKPATKQGSIMSFFAKK